MIRHKQEFCVSDKSERQYTIYEKTIDKREAVFADLPGRLLPEIKDYLISRDIKKLYVHQAEMFDSTCDGENVVITTSTASGKTLSFLLPVLQEILKNPLARAIFVYPTKALASDQYRAMLPMVEFFGKNKIAIGVYDGDTPVNERSRIRNSANIILTNPEMLNSAFLPHHNSHGFNFIFSNLKYVVIDELHTYRGAFGSHFANVFRRLNRVCNYYSSSPQFLCSSATIANPIELAEKVCGKNFYHVHKDGSPAPKKKYYFLQPPIIKGTEYRKPVSELVSNLIPELIMNDKSLISFCKTRKAVEIILKESRDKLKADGILNQDYADLVSGYRGGYTPLERKEIENKMVSGTLKGLISTNALELGIDIGKVDTTVLTGYPGTRASFWQQSGRAGRSGKTSETFLVLDNLPFDQYLSIEPDWLFQTSSENAVIDKNNLYIQLAHIRSASAELPLTLDDIALFPDLGEIIPVLIRAKELRSENGKFIWCGKEFPAGDYSLRNMDKSRYKLVNSITSSVLTEMDEAQAFREIYEGAIYMHDGQSYQVLSLDLESKTATARPTEENFYTEPFADSELSIIKTHKDEKIGRTSYYFGDINVTETVGGYKKLQFHNHQNLGFEDLSQKLTKAFDTEGVWIDIPKNVDAVFKKLIPEKQDKSNFNNYWKNYFDGLSFAIQNATMMSTMTTKEDISAGTISLVDNSEFSAVCIYDLFVGGLGYSEKAYDKIDEIISSAIKMVRGCKCKDGCPACIGDYKLDKKIVLWGLKNFYEEIEEPKNLKIPRSAKITIAEKPFKFEELAQKWVEFKEFISQKGEYLSKFLVTIDAVQTEDEKLILGLQNEFYKSWILESDNKIKLKNMLMQYIYLPNNFDIDVVVGSEEKRFDREKIDKRYIDLISR